MAAAYLLPRWVKWPHVGKNVTLFSYMVMQHAAHLEIYPLGGTWLVQERKGRGRDERCLYGVVGVTGPIATGLATDGSWRSPGDRFPPRYIRSAREQYASWHLERETSFLLFRPLFPELFRDVPLMFFFWIKYDQYFYGMANDNGKDHKSLWILSFFPFFFFFGEFNLSERWQDMIEF